MHKSQIALGERWKWHFQASRFQNFLGEHAPDPSSGSRLRRSRAPPTYITLATALITAFVHEVVRNVESPHTV